MKKTFLVSIFAASISRKTTFFMGTTVVLTDLADSSVFVFHNDAKANSNDLTNLNNL